MPTTPKDSRVAKAGVGLAVAAAIVGGTLVAKDQLTSGASRATSQDRYSDLQRTASAGTRTVPFLGPFARINAHGRTCGPEVRLMEGALRRTQPPIRIGPARNCIGLATEKQIKLLQSRNNIPTTGIYGLRTHRALARRYTTRQIADLRYIRIKRIQAIKYATIAAVTAHAKAYEGRMIYCEFGQLRVCGRRFVWPPWPDVPRHTDCSGYASWVYFTAGLPDPNGLGYTGGYTGTLVRGGIPVSPSSAANLKVGDLIFNGPSAFRTTHVSIYVGKGLSSGHGKFAIQIHQWNYRPVVAIRRYF